jgi:hypothetical protein
LVVAGLTALSKSHCEVREGILATWGGFARRFLSSRLVRAKAMALGHVVMARNRRELDVHWTHECGHVRQAEIWGIAFVPAYLLASVWAFLRGRHYYTDNWFEKDADRRSGLR